MKLKYYVPIELSLPVKTVKRLERAVREHWQMKPDAEVSNEDLLIQADKEGLLPEPLPIDFKAG